MDHAPDAKEPGAVAVDRNHPVEDDLDQPHLRA
jgi:hypothetical protein